MKQRAAVILAGGAGTRLHPLSSEENPKQFLILFAGQSLLQLTFRRIAQMVPLESIFISTNDRYRDHCIRQLPQIDPANILTEPSRRNTAPAIALCTFEIATRLGEDVTIGFFPSDAYVRDEPEFVRVLERAYDFATSSDHLVTVAIRATEPNTGFGYLELGDTLAPGVVALRRFTEKPALELAQQFLAAGNYAWNGGIFVWRAGTFRDAVAAVAPALSSVSRATYDTLPPLSIDYALMEKAPRVATVQGDFGWSDVGSFPSLRAAGAEIPEGIG